MKVVNRTKAALRVKKEAGALLGNRTNLTDARIKAGEAKTVAARAFADRVRPEIERMKAGGESLNKITARLNVMGVPTARDGAWTAKAVSRVLTYKRMD